MAIGDDVNVTTADTSDGTAATVNIPTIDHNHPLFLQPTYTLGSTLISLQLIGSDNYALWSRSIRIGLLGKSKLGFVDERFPKSKFAPELYDQWEKVNVVVLSWIMNAVRPGLLSSVVYASDAHKVWEDLKERFDKVNESRVLYLHREIHTLTQGTMTIFDYILKLRDLWYEFDALMPYPGCPCPELKKYAQHFEQHRLLQFLMGLNESYSQSRNQIMIMSPILSINKAYSLLVDQESQRSSANFSHVAQVSETMESTALYSNRTSINSGADSKPKKKGGTPGPYANHASADVNQHGEGPQMQAGVQHPPPPSPYLTQQQYQQIVQLLNKSAEEGSSSKAAAAGNVVTVSHSGNTTVLKDHNISDVLFIPDFKYTLLSVSQLTKELQCLVAFFPDFCIFQDLYNGHVLGIGKEEHGLYLLKGNSFQKSQLLNKCAHTANLSSESISDESTHLWHLRLGHAPIDVIKRHDILRALKNVGSYHCTVCPVAKQSQLPFQLSTTATKSIFELLHCDIWGPYRNGVVERKHRTILEMARSLKFQAAFPLKFWGECVSTAVYLINRLPSRVLHKKPFEMLYLHPPSLTHLRVFGCFCYASSPKENDKFAPRALPAVLLAGEVYSQDASSHPSAPCQELPYAIAYVPNEEHQYSATSSPTEFNAPTSDSHDQPSETPPPQELRKSTRERKQPA
ncbi:PREDICTED: uncharacterized protein LOC109213202 [Nicotiana attenuata]|uniref:uncharacterized protein LOC109213202 n=1 Tax=Nicotiana attenuata TaxID=49451 RepID=UPI000904BD0C|nr:PREDICTED: uncharacterized protein LOC109213202 [Nicotiana attenuata]